MNVSRRQRLTLVAAIRGSAITAIDGTIVNVALPAIEHDPGGGLAAQQWVSNGSQLALASLILIGGSLGDIYGYRRVLTVGVSPFGMLSVAAAPRPAACPKKAPTMIGAIIGPLAGGWIVDATSWRFIFALNVPLVLVTLLSIRAAVPRSDRLVASRID